MFKTFTPRCISCHLIILFTFYKRIIIGSDRRPETKQGIEGKIVRFRSQRVRDKVRDRVRDEDRRSERDHRSEAINFGAC